MRALYIREINRIELEQGEEFGVGLTVYARCEDGQEHALRGEYEVDYDTTHDPGYLKENYGFYEPTTGAGCDVCMYEGAWVVKDLRVVAQMVFEEYMKQSRG